MLTRRGRAVAVVAAGGFVMAGWFGARALNAVVAPALVGLAAGYLQLRRADRPDLDVEAPEYGFAGETAAASLTFDASTPVTGTVRIEVEDGLAVDDGEVETTVGDGSLTVDVELARRGVRSVGPVEVEAEDVLGLWRTTHRYPIRRDVVVFPRIHRLTDAGDLVALHRQFGIAGRDRFDQLREYERGDPLRDVHWKSSARRPDDLIVMEFEASERREQVELVAEAGDGRVDDVAEAAASVAAHLLDAGMAVGLTVPGGRIEPDVGDDHRTELFTLLARARAGSVGDRGRERADVAVSGRSGESTVEVAIGDRTVTFDQLAGGASVGGRPVDARADGGGDRR